MSTQIDTLKPQLAVALPPHISADKFKGVVMTAVNLNPDLLKADRRSLFNACNKAAADGLLPDGREGAFVIFSTKQKIGERETWIKAVQWMPMVYGLIKKIRQSGEVASIGARIVYEAETKSPLDASGNVMCDDNGKPLPPRFQFKIVDGEEILEHQPMLWGERGPMVLVYAYAKFKDGTKEFEPLTKADVEKMRAVSRSKDKGPWVEWYEEMAKKSAIRRLAKRLPLTAEIMAAVTRDDEMTEIDRARIAARDGILSEASRQLGAPRTEEIVDAETGEITTRETEDQGEVIVGEEVASEAEAEDQAFTAAEQTTARLIENLGDTTMKLTDLEEFKTSAHDIINGQEIAEDQKSVLLGRFNAAFLERRKAFGKQGAKAGAR